MTTSQHHNNEALVVRELDYDVTVNGQRYASAGLSLSISTNNDPFITGLAIVSYNEVADVWDWEADARSLYFDQSDQWSGRGETNNRPDAVEAALKVLLDARGSVAAGIQQERA